MSIPSVVVPLATLPTPVGKARSLYAAFEFLGQRAGLQDRHIGGQAEAVPDRLPNSCGDRGHIDVPPGLDGDEQHLEVARRHQLGLEVRDMDVAEHEILELRVVEVDPADLEESGRAVRMLDQRKDRIGMTAVLAGAP